MREARRRREGAADFQRVPQGNSPVPVDVGSETAGSRDLLTVFAPQAIGRLGVGETVRVDDGKDVKVVFVLERLGVRISRCEQLVGRVFNRHSGDPLSRMHSTVPYDTLLGTLAAASPDVYTLNVAPLEGLASNENLRIAGVGGSKVF